MPQPAEAARRDRARSGAQRVGRKIHVREVGVDAKGEVVHATGSFRHQVAEAARAAGAIGDAKLLSFARGEVPRKLGLSSDDSIVHRLSLVVLNGEAVEARAVGQ